MTPPAAPLSAVVVSLKVIPLKFPAREKNTASFTAMASPSQRHNLDRVNPVPDARHFVESVLFFLGLFMVVSFPLFVT